MVCMPGGCLMCAAITVKATAVCHVHTQAALADGEGTSKDKRKCLSRINTRRATAGDCRNNETCAGEAAAASIVEELLPLGCSSLNSV